MSDIFIKESSIEDSFIYKSFNASNSLIDKLVKYIKTGVLLESSYFEEQYMQMKRSAISPLSKNVIEAYDNGDIELLFSRDSKIGTSIPFIIRKNEKGKVVATIFIASFATIDKNDNLSIPVKQLYALMESAYVALEMQISPMKIQRNMTLMKLCASVYSQMMLRILNKEYALSLDKTLYDKANYVITRFFLERVWEYPNKELVNAYATAELNNLENLDLDMLKHEYDSLDIKDVNDMISLLQSISPRMAELNTRYFIERFVNTYHGSSILCIDYLPYVFFVIINIILGSFLISQTALNDVIKNTKNINKFYPELSRLV